MRINFLVCSDGTLWLSSGESFEVDRNLKAGELRVSPAHFVSYINVDADNYGGGRDRGDAGLRMISDIHILNRSTLYHFQTIVELLATSCFQAGVEYAEAQRKETEKPRRRR